MVLAYWKIIFLFVVGRRVFFSEAYLINGVGESYDENDDLVFEER